jgi:Icc-related predicted phosphoesterase
VRLLAIAHIGGRLDLLDQVREIVEPERPDMIFFAGGAFGTDSDPVRTHAELFAFLEKFGVPSYCIPGEADGPERLYLVAALSHQSLARNVHIVHGAFSSAPAHGLAVVGFGGAITDDEREHATAVRYPGWELVARLQLLRGVDQPPLMLLHHPPAEAEGGRQEVSEVIKTWHPRLAVCAGRQPGTQWVGDTLVVSPGRLDEGCYALAETKDRTVRHEQLRQEVTGRTRG